MKKKKVLILMKTMNIGGAERSLLGLLGSFDYIKYDVYLMLFKHEGEFLNFIPSQVKILPYQKEFSVFESPLTSLLSPQFIQFFFAKILGKANCFFFQKFTKVGSSSWLKQQYFSKFITPLLPPIKGKYDLAINFLGTPNVLVKKVDAKVKMCWLHTDYNQISANKNIDLNNYKLIDFVVNVSEDCMRVFNKHYPDLYQKSIVLENILSKKLILSQSNEFCVKSEMPDKSNTIRILSLGRFGRAKNFESVPEIAKKIIENGFDIKWYIIGYGNDEEKIKAKIKDFQMEDRVIILGKKINPYPYIKECDFYIQPSLYEGKSVTVREAQILGKPVIITNYETAKSQVKNAVDGFIVPLDIASCARGICDILVNDVAVASIKKNCLSKKFDNEDEVKKIYKLF